MTGFFGLLLIALGEIAGIAAEMFVVRGATNGGIPWALVLRYFPLMVIAGACLLFGYILAYREIQNIWIVSAVSISSIMIVEPTLDYLLFDELPTKGAWVALSLAVIAIVFALGWRE